MKNLFLFVLMTALTVSVFSQTEIATTNADTADYPYWVDMMQDPDANFFETQRAFEKYWQRRQITRGS